MYWNVCGKSNTDETIDLAVKKAKELNLEFIVVGSRTGETALKLADCGLKVICVTHHIGYNSPGTDEMSGEMREKLASSGIPVLTTTHLMAGLDRAVRNKFGGVYPSEIIAQTLRMLGQGVKVCVEIAGMALDAGLIPHGVDIVSVSGTGLGADTALVIAPAHSHQFFDTKVREILCKPREF